MPEPYSILQAAGMAVLALAGVAWLIGITRMLRRARAEAIAWHAAQDTALSALPGPREVGPRLEAVELTPAERDAFAGLVRRLNNGH
ncbi:MULTISPECIES: hypothetical protein [unclassified Streptomyces]|jgi:hypothetical protein|uniref:hypothetical protein n=1 Tax=unclassified Streptomyces TaxID=2593676 RepID=UPI003454262B